MTDKILDKINAQFKRLGSELKAIPTDRRGEVIVDNTTYDPIHLLKILQILKPATDCKISKKAILSLIKPAIF